MRAHKIATATMLVLAVSGWAVAGTGTAFAENGPAAHRGVKAKTAGKGHPAHGGGGRAKARAEGGSSTGGNLFQQNVAQSSRQNNNCNNPNPQTGDTELSGSRVTGRCVTSDGSLTAFSRIHNGPADAEGGSAVLDVVQQNTAQRGRQNNTCNSPNNALIDVTESRVESRCADQDFSFSKHTHIKGGGAQAHGGSSTSTVDDVFEQNAAQEGRQNNNCNNPNFDFDLEVAEGSRVEAHCGNLDSSFSKHTHIKGGGAQAHGGSTGSAVRQQNAAQEGRQNNNCNNPNSSSDLDVTAGGRVEARCGNLDASFSKHTYIKGGGARTEGGSSTASVDQQNASQEGRQNNNCNNPNFESDMTLDGGRVEARCGNLDASFSKHTYIKGGGARTEGGSSTAGGTVIQQNIAQEGRQNNTCNHPNQSNPSVTGGRVEVRCGNLDASFSKHTRIKGGGARAEGGSSTGSDLNQQNVAQEGRQNNTCDHPNASSDLNVAEGSRVEVRCGNLDASFSKHTRIKGGGARAEGGSSTGSTVDQQNAAQEGRQNNNCNNRIDSLVEPGEGSRVEDRCGNLDTSFSKHTHIKGGGAQASGGTSTAEVEQQNIAQEGRQNNTCNNPNEGSDINPDVNNDIRVERRCGNLDTSFSKHTYVKGGGARTEGGSSTGSTVNQQNIAQEGRQNNTCNNANLESDLETEEGSRVAGRCGNLDTSFSKHTYVKGGGARTEGGSSTGSTVNQQNIAQEGRQNNTCNNANNTEINLIDGSQTNSACQTTDHSANIHTKDIRGGAKTTGGNATAELFQQNIAQEGRQNNSCNNLNSLQDFTLTGSRTQAHCITTDRSTNIGTIHR
ncbi:hypothetical protein [Streptomyces sp. NPDC051776]|uniref:hypothetical protein n=1 Tax=Streptomyces sp. NPDC051776 TaxID=3155414 RepID=UPI003448FDD7